MTRFLASLSIAAVLTAAAQAQCLPAPSGAVQTLTATSGLYPADDEGRTVPAVALGFTFPMANALPLSPGATHAFIESNGELYLTNLAYGLISPSGASAFGVNSLAELRGVAFSNPRICPYSGDIEAGNGGVWGVYADTSVANQITVQWNDVWSWTGGAPTGSFSFACTLYNTGVIDFSYSAIGTFDPLPFNWVAVSIGNQVGTGTEVSQDLSAGADSGALGMLFEEFATVAPDLEGQTLRFTPNGLGGFTSSIICTSAFNKNYGVGCYDYNNIVLGGVYELYSTPAAANTALQGQSMVATPTATGYTFTWGGGTFVAPGGGATVLSTLGDDNEVGVTPSLPVPSPYGSIANLSVCSNGFVNMGGVGNNYLFSYGSVFELLNCAIPSFRSNADYDCRATASPGGTVTTEEAGGILYITWNNIERYNGNVSTGFSDRFQFQMNLATGTVVYVWDAIQTNNGFGLVVGYTVGTITDPGPSVLATALPITTDAVFLSALALSAAPAPIITLGGTGPSVPVTWTVSNVPDLAPPFGIGLALAMFSVAPIPGFDMTFLGMPGCDLNIASLDAVVGFPGLAPVDSLTFSIPQPLAPGTSFYAQVLALFNPNSLPNGQNSFGGVLSNGVQSYFNSF